MFCGDCVPYAWYKFEVGEWAATEEHKVRNLKNWHGICDESHCYEVFVNWTILKAQMVLLICVMCNNLVGQVKGKAECRNLRSCRYRHCLQWRWMNHRKGHLLTWQDVIILYGGELQSHLMFVSVNHQMVFCGEPLLDRDGRLFRVFGLTQQHRPKEELGTELPIHISPLSKGCSMEQLSSRDIYIYYQILLHKVPFGEGWVSQALELELRVLLKGTMKAWLCQPWHLNQRPSVHGHRVLTHTGTEQPTVTTSECHGTLQTPLLKLPVQLTHPYSYKSSGFPGDRKQFKDDIKNRKTASHSGSCLKPLNHGRKRGL